MNGRAGAVLVDEFQARCALSLYHFLDTCSIQNGGVEYAAIPIFFVYIGWPGTRVWKTIDNASKK